MKKSRKINILFLESSSGCGGSSNALANVVNYLDKEIFHKIIAIKNYGPQTDKIRDYEIIKLRDFKEAERLTGFEYLLYFIKNIIPETIKICFIIHNKNIDVLHINTNITLGLPVILAARLSGIPCVCHIRETRKLIRREKFFSKWVDKFIVLNTDALNLYKQDIPENKINVIFDGLALDDRQIEAKVRFKTEFNLNSNPVVGVIGRIIEGKGQKEFILAAKEALKSKPQVKCIIVGDSKGSSSDIYYEEVLSLVRDEDLQRNIIFTGWREDVDRIILDLNILVLPSTTFPEGLPNALIEAMVLNKPVIATDIPGPRDIVVDGQTGFLVPPGDIKAMAEKIIYLLDNPEIARKMGESGRKRAEELFDIKKQVKKIEAVYEEVLSHR